MYTPNSQETAPPNPTNSGIKYPPELYSPNMAVNLSVLLTPAFGPYLHARNWKALGYPSRARRSMIYFWLVVVDIFAIFVSLIFSYLTKFESQHFIGAGVVILIVWYFLEGRPQADLVKSQYRNYIPKSFSSPLLIAVPIVAILFISFQKIEERLYSDPDLLALRLKTQIGRDIQENPQWKGVEIVNVTILSSNGKFRSGYVESVSNGQVERHKISVTIDRKQMQYELTPMPP